MLDQNSSSLEIKLLEAQNRSVKVERGLITDCCAVGIICNVPFLYSVTALEEELCAVREERDSQLRQLHGKMEQTSQSLQHQYSVQEAKVRL